MSLEMNVPCHVSNRQWPISQPSAYCPIRQCAHSHLNYCFSLPSPNQALMRGAPPLTHFAPAKIELLWNSRPSWNKLWYSHEYLVNQGGKPPKTLFSKVLASRASKRQKSHLNPHNYLRNKNGIFFNLQNASKTQKLSGTIAIANVEPRREVMCMTFTNAEACRLFTSNQMFDLYQKK